MLFMILLVATVVTLGLRSMLRPPSLARDAARGAQEAAAPSGAAPESLEGVLVAQLMNGQINQQQYRRTIEGLAARDEDRHPLATPPETGAADA